MLTRWKKNKKTISSNPLWIRHFSKIPKNKQSLNPRCKLVFVGAHKWKSSWSQKQMKRSQNGTSIGFTSLHVYRSMMRARRNQRRRNDAFNRTRKTPTITLTHDVMTRWIPRGRRNSEHLLVAQSAIRFSVRCHQSSLNRGCAASINTLPLSSSDLANDTERSSRHRPSCPLELTVRWYTDRLLVESPCYITWTI